MSEEKGQGAYTWLIPDGYLPEIPEGATVGPTGYYSHESLCILNTGKEPAEITMDVYFEDREPIKDIKFTVEAERSMHLRMEKLKEKFGKEIPRGVCYSLRVRSNKKIVVQLSRLDTTQANMALFTSLGFPVDE